MTIMNTELYEALKEAGASDEKAKAASNIVEEQNKRFDKIDRRFDTMQSDIDRRFDTLDNRLNMMKTENKADFKEVRTSIETVKFQMKHMESRVIFKMSSIVLAIVSLAVAIILGGIRMMLP